MTGLARDGLAAAWHLLLRVPCPWAPRRPWHEAAGAAGVWFPVLGALIGTAAAAVHAVLAGRPLLAGAAAALTLAWLPGGMHADALADTADAWFSGQRGAGALAVMKDPRVGALGALALTCDLLLRWAALSSLPAGGAWALLPAAAAGARWAGAWALARHRYLREEGMGKAFHASIRQGHVLIGAVITAGAAAAGGPGGVAAGLAAAVVGAGAAAVLARRWGGLTGDGCGAVIEIAEVAGLVAAAVTA